MNILRTIAKSIPLVVLLLIVGELVWSNTLVASGRAVTTTDIKIANVRAENEVLAQEVASASAFTTIAVEASASGFIAPTAKQFVMMNTSNLPVALAP